MLTRTQLEQIFPIGTRIAPTDFAITTAIENQLVLEIQYAGNAQGSIGRLRDCRFYTFGTGTGDPWSVSKNYIRFYHLAGYSVSAMGLITYNPTESGLSGWRSALQDNIVSMGWTGRKFSINTTPTGYNPAGDAFLNVITQLTI